MGYKAQPAWKCLFTTTGNIFEEILTGNVDCKSLCAAVMMCVTEVNIHTQTALDSLYDRLSQLS